MKITKQQLKQIIKEELSSVSEGDRTDVFALNELENQLVNLKSALEVFLEPYDAGRGHALGTSLARSAAIEETLSLVDSTLASIEDADPSEDPLADDSGDTYDLPEM